MTFEVLLELKSVSEVEEEATNAEQEKEKDEQGLTLERVSHTIKKAKELQWMIEACDFCIVRAFNVITGIDAAIQIYKTLFATMKKRPQ